MTVISYYCKHRSILRADGERCPCTRAVIISEQPYMCKCQCAFSESEWFYFSMPLHPVFISSLGHSRRSQLSLGCYLITPFDHAVRRHALTRLTRNHECA